MKNIETKTFFHYQTLIKTLKLGNAPSFLLFRIKKTPDELVIFIVHIKFLSGYYYVWE